MDQGTGSDKPRMTPLQDGPLRYERSAGDGPVGDLVDARGERPQCEHDVLLCRCGQSARKPFCDFTHARVGFTSEKRSSGRLDRRVDFEGESATIHDNRQACAHVEFCIQELPEVFSRDGKPWVDPNGADPERVAAQTKRCPSGALSVTVGGAERRDFAREPRVWAQPNGPYFVEGAVELVDEPFAEGVSREHYTLCRCGASRNKPFCDGKHWSVGFTDPEEPADDEPASDEPASTE